MFRSSLLSARLPGRRGRRGNKGAKGCLSDLSTAASPSFSMKPRGLQYRHSPAKPASELFLQAARLGTMSRRHQAFDLLSLQSEHIRHSPIAPREKPVRVIAELSSGSSAFLLLTCFEARRLAKASILPLADSCPRLNQANERRYLTKPFLAEESKPLLSKKRWASLRPIELRNMIFEQSFNAQ